ncbi:MAG: VWA domain-containing protein [Mucinivorans sp.]
MSHTAQITETARALFILMIDQSGSMNEPYAPCGEKTKAQMVADVCNNTITELVARCRDGNMWRHYFDIAVIGYSGRGVYSLLPEDARLLSPAQLAWLVKSKRVVQNTCTTASGARLTIHSSYKVWIDPYAEGKTPMYAAFGRVLEILLAWRADQSSLEGFPPTIINITDGEPTDATDASLRELVDRIRGHGTADGEPIIFNVHISSSSDRQVSFPDRTDDLPQEARLLFYLSSIMPDSYRLELSDQLPTKHSPSMRAMAYNAGVNELIRVMNIGSSTITLHK